jgi:hypothetical protein
MLTHGRRNEERGEYARPIRRKVGHFKCPFVSERIDFFAERWLVIGPDSDGLVKAHDRMFRFSRRRVN